METLILNAGDLVAMSFWIISTAMIASTFFFFVERDRAVGKWKTTLSVAAIVTGLSAINYHYLREIWVLTNYCPSIYRYIDWALTAPLQAIEFYLILSTATKVNIRVFWRLLIATIIMFVAYYTGELNYREPNFLWGCFLIGLLSWLYLLYEIYCGESGKLCKNKGTRASQHAFEGIRTIVTFGWAIYPLAYLYGYANDGNPALINIVYNLVDFINKIAFGMIIWSAATKSTSTRK